MRNIVIITIGIFASLLIGWKGSQLTSEACSYSGSYDTGDAYYADYGTAPTEHEFYPEQRSAK